MPTPSNVIRRDYRGILANFGLVDRAGFFGIAETATFAASAVSVFSHRGASLAVVPSPSYVNGPTPRTTRLSTKSTALFSCSWQWNGVAASADAVTIPLRLARHWCGPTCSYDALVSKTLSTSHMIVSFLSHPLG
jgi:hypothetical protein